MKSTDINNSSKPEMLQLSGGRKLCFQRYGAVEGAPAYFFHGFPGCRFQAELVHAQAKEAGMCLVAFDRPGFGQSEYDSQRSFASTAGDVLALADHLGHDRFPVIGVSCGGAYALACAHDMPDRVSRVGLFSGMGPMDIPEIRKSQLPVLSIMFALANVSPVLVTPLLALDWLMFRRNPQRAVKVLARMLTAPDQAFLRLNEESAEIFGRSLGEAYRQGIKGAMREAALIGSPRPYDFSRIAQPVSVYQPVDDRHVPVEMGKYIAASVRNGKLVICEEDGHLSVLINKFPMFAKELQL